MKVGNILTIRRVIGMVIVLWALLHQSAFADDWYDYYRQAKQAAQKKDWPTAISLFNKAIADEPEPAKHKQYGLRAFSYYPYLELGMAYLAVGDMEAAWENCAIADRKRSAPEDVVNTCLSFASKYLPKTPTPSPIPTAAQALAQAHLPEHPTIRLTATPPAVTGNDAIVLQGSALDRDGVAMIKFYVKNRGITGITTFTTPNRQEEPFNIEILLDFGPTEIRIEVTDTQGEKGEHTLFIERPMPNQPTAKPVPPTAAPAPPTPVPVVPTAIPVPVKPTPIPMILPTATPMPPVLPTTPPVNPSAKQPTLRLLSEIPSETSQAILTITGVAEDADGIVDIAVDVEQPGSRGLVLEIDDDADRGPQPHREFTKEVPLEIGLNTVKVLVRNTAGLEQTASFQVTRIATARTDVTGPAGDMYAVIIGIADYADKRLNLNYTVNDAQGLYDVLTDPKYGGVPPDNIQLLLNEEATDRNIKRAIGKWLAQQADEDDTVIIYYSGHGAKEGGDTYWVTYNADIDDLYSTALSNIEISDMLDRIQSQRMITFLDSCYSEATVHRKDKTRSIATEIPWENFTGTGRVVISASDGKQLSLELDQLQHGVFTYYLLEGLRGKADNNKDYVVDVEEIWGYVNQRVSEMAKKMSNEQTPVFQGRLTSGISLTVNLAGIEEQQKLEEQEKIEKIAKLQHLFEAGKLSVEHLNCTFIMVEAGQSDVYLDNLLAGKLLPEIFSRSFSCP